MFTIRTSRQPDRPVLLGIWRRAVRATHDFLTPQHFTELETIVAESYLPHAALWVAVDGQDRAVGFMGLSQTHIDTLFIDPDLRGKGIGTMLVEHARQSAGAVTVDVNEQNGQAVGFYDRLGFRQTGRSEVDDEGRPYPLLHLRMIA